MLSSPRCCLLLSLLFAFALGDVGLGGVDAKCVICGNQIRISFFFGIWNLLLLLLYIISSQVWPSTNLKDS